MSPESVPSRQRDFLNVCKHGRGERCAGAVADVMLVLLLLYLASHSWAKDVPRDSNYTIKYVSSCPDAGYFFQREPTGNSLLAPCYLCFCQGRHTAICWPRENRRCDVQHYKHNYSIAKKETRLKRSPLGFADVFFKDAARDVFNKAEPEVCKPYESSFSEGCPPVDWCTGCTVCDCDADGHWDCHVLSFCDDEKDKGKKHSKKGSNVTLNYPKSRSKSALKQKTNSIIKTTKKPPVRTMSTTKRPQYKKLKEGPSKATKPRSLIQKGKPAKPLIIKTNEKNPKVVKSSPSKKVLNGSEKEMNEQIMKTMKAAMQKMWEKQVTSALPDIVSMIQKRSFSNRTQNKKGNAPVKYKKISRTTQSDKPHTYNKSLFIRKQKKEEQKKELQRKRDTQKEDLAARNKTTKKPVPKAVNRNNKPINRSTKKPFKSANMPTTKKPSNKTNNNYNKPNNNSNNKRAKREVNFNNKTDSLRLHIVVSDLAVIPASNIESTTKQVILESPTTTNVIDNIVTTNTMYKNTNYYKYSENVTTEDPTVGNETNYNNTNIEVVIKKVDNETNVGQEIEKTKLNLANEIPNEVANDIKLTKWSEIKMFQVKENETHLNFNKTDASQLTNKISETRANSKEEQKKPIIWREIEKKIDRTTKKYSLQRMVNTKNCKSKKGKQINFENLSGTSLSGKIENLRNVLKRLLGEFRGNNSTLESKSKKTNAIKYLKKLFNKIFFKNSNKTNIIQRMRNNNHTIQILCESFGPCVVNRKNKGILIKKIKQLNNETVQILKSLRIIKGLLRLVDIPHDTTIITLNKTSNFKRDIHKLNVILKKSFDNDKDKEEFSETQRIQINYIKKNTKVFTQSVARFTKILNEIIDLIAVKNNFEKQRKWLSETKSNKSKTRVDSLKKFKQLIYNYNTLHNAFIAKIIDLFTKLQSNHYVVQHENNKTADVSGFDYNSNNVIRNMNKLKNLASALNPQKRQKRHAVRQDNSVEYLLMLMEYMFQQNQLDNSPVNDGIDLLIEAIKNAPDIKSVKNKVLQNNPVRINDVKIAEPVFTKNVSSEDSISDNNILSEASDDQISSENRIMNKVSNENSYSILNTNDNSSLLDQRDSIDEENESDLQILKLKTANDEKVETNTKIADDQDDTNFASLDGLRKKSPSIEQVNTQKPNDFETSTDLPSKVYVADDDALTDFDSRLEKASGEINKKTEANNSELDEENTIEESLGDSKTTTFKDDHTELPIVTKSDKAVSKSYKSDTKIAKTNTKKEVRQKLKEKKLQTHNNGELGTIEWIDDARKIDDTSDSVEVLNNTLKESPRISPKLKKKYIITTTAQVTTNINKPAQIFEIDLSDASKENSEEKVKVKKSEDVMIKKEEDLLNSLDYGTEASIVEDSELKNGVEEKFLNDYFAQ